MSEVSPSRRDQVIIRYYLHNKGPRAIARKVKRSPSTVSYQIDEFKKMVEREGKERAARRHNVTDELDRVRQINEFLDENKSTPEAMLEGGKIVKLLEILNIPQSELRRFLTKVESRSREKGYDTSAIIADCQRINELERTYVKSFSEMKVDYVKMGTALPETYVGG